MPANAQGVPVEKKPAPPLSFRGRGHRVRILFALIDLFFWFLFTGEKLLGVGIVRVIVPPFLMVELWRRRRDYSKFQGIRNILPAEFWKGISTPSHYYRMVRNWNEGGAVALLYSRLGRPHWKKRFTVRGPMPTEHPEWGKRPVIFAFMHTGPFGVLLPWLRSQGIPAAGLVGGLPLMMETDAYRVPAEAADREYGLAGVPAAFRRREISLRDVLRFLTPGHALLIALDGGKLRDDVEQCTVDGLPILVRKGACRLAVRTGALVIPISIHRSGPCRFEIRFGRPVPDELLRQKDITAALQFLLDEQWKEIVEHPDDLNWTTLEALAPHLRARRVGWP